MCVEATSLSRDHSVFQASSCGLAATPVLPHVKAAPPFAIALGVENTHASHAVQCFLTFELLRGSGRR